MTKNNEGELWYLQVFLLQFSVAFTVRTSARQNVEKLRSGFKILFLIHEDIYLQQTVEGKVCCSKAHYNQESQSQVPLAFKGKQRLEIEKASIPMFPVIGQLAKFRCEDRERTIGEIDTFWDDAKDPPPRRDEGGEVVDEEKFLRRGSK